MAREAHARQAIELLAARARQREGAGGSAGKERSEKGARGGTRARAPSSGHAQSHKVHHPVRRQARIGGQEALVQPQDALCARSLERAVQAAAVQRHALRLVHHARLYHVKGRGHYRADKAADQAAQHLRHQALLLAREHEHLHLGKVVAGDAAAVDDCGAANGGPQALAKARQALLARDALQGVERAAVARRLPQRLEAPVRLDAHLDQVKGVGHELPQAAAQRARQHAQVQRRGLGVRALANDQLADGRVQPHANAAVHKLPQRRGAQAAVHGQQALCAQDVRDGAQQPQRLGLGGLARERPAQLVLQLQAHLGKVQRVGGGLAAARRHAAHKPPLGKLSGVGHGEVLRQDTACTLLFVARTATARLTSPHRPAMASSEFTNSVYLLTLGFFFVFAAFNTVQLLESSVLSDKNLAFTTLSTIYAVFAATNIVAPKVVSLLGPRLGMFLGSMCYVLLVVANIAPKIG